MMRKTVSVLVLGFVIVVGPLASGQGAAPQPDKDGVYVVFGDVKPPKLVHVNPATVASGVELPDKYICTLSMVVGADGIPTNIEVVEKRNSSLDDAAIEAVKSAQFEPATLKGKPVPVIAFTWVPFLDLSHPAIPLAGPLDKIPNLTVPRVLNQVEAEFSKEARRKHHSGTVLATMMVTEEGTPADARIVVPAGFGLDEQALKAIRNYRFSPSTLDGVPVPVPIVIEVNFKFSSW